MYILKFGVCWIIFPQSTAHSFAISVKVNIMIRHDGAVMWHGDMTTPLVTLCTLLSRMSHEESRGWCHPPGRGGVAPSLALIIPASDPGLEAGPWLAWPGRPHSLHYRSGRGFHHTGLSSPHETKKWLKIGKWSYSYILKSFDVSMFMLKCSCFEFYLFKFLCRRKEVWGCAEHWTFRSAHSVLNLTAAASVRSHQSRRLFINTLEKTWLKQKSCLWGLLLEVVSILQPVIRSICKSSIKYYEG